jgi:hypothetical protein
VHDRWCLWVSVGVLWYWFTLLLCFLSTDSVIQLLEESNELLELLRDIVKQGKSIFDLVVQVPHEHSTFPGSFH